MQQMPFDKVSALIADNSPHMADLIAIMLRGIGLKQVATATDGSAAFNLLRTRRVDLLIVADDLAGIDGVDLTRRLRLSDGGVNREVAVIMTSAEPDAVGIAAARDAGITEFLRKPFSAEHVATRLDAMMRSARDFVAGGNYAGPDRRRRKMTAGRERRGTA